MALNEITDEDIREYILGQSPAEKADRLDELSFVDEYSERIGAVEREMIDDYVGDVLDSDEKAAFESHYLSSALRRERVEFAKAFSDFASRSHPSAAPAPAKWSIFDLFRQRMIAVQFGAVAMLLIVGVVAWLVLRDSPPNVALNEPVSAPLPATETEDVRDPAPVQSAAPTSDVTRTSPPNATATPTRRPVTPTPRKVEQPRLATFLLTPALRSQSFQQIEIPSGATAIELQLRLESDVSGPLSVEIVDLSQRKSVWSAKNLSARTGRAAATANIKIPSRALNRGQFQVSLSQTTKEGTSEKIGDYFFRVAQ